MGQVDMSLCVVEPNKWLIVPIQPVIACLHRTEIHHSACLDAVGCRMALEFSQFGCSVGAIMFWAAMRFDVGVQMFPVNNLALRYTDTNN